MVRVFRDPRNQPTRERFTTPRLPVAADAGVVSVRDAESERFDLLEDLRLCGALMPNLVKAVGFPVVHAHIHHAHLCFCDEFNRCFIAAVLFFRIEGPNATANLKRKKNVASCAHRKSERKPIERRGSWMRA